MNIDLKKPINSSLFSIIITFLLSIMVLFITKPSYITEIDRKKRKKRINIYRLFIYSILFSLLVGICVLFIPIKTTNPVQPAPPAPPILVKSYIPN